jgi:hypothetical protein
LTEGEVTLPYFDCDHYESTHDECDIYGLAQGLDFSAQQVQDRSH